MDSTCPSCNARVNKSELGSHVESIHIGPRQLKSMYFICCGVCPFKVPEGRTLEIAEHCHKTGHDGARVSTDWSTFIESESERVVKIVAYTALYLKKQESGTEKLRQGENQTNNSKKKQTPVHSDSASKRTRTQTALPGDTSSQSEDDTRSSSSTERHSKEGLSKEGEKSSDNRANPPSSYNFHPKTQTGSWKESIVFNLLDNYPESNREMRKIHRCRLCKFSIKTVCGSMARAQAVNHTVTHNDLRLFQCQHCPFTAKRRDKITAHKKIQENTGMKCDGSYIDRQDDQSLLLIRNQLNECFPDIPWKNYQGKSIAGIRI